MIEEGRDPLKVDENGDEIEYEGDESEGKDCVSLLIDWLIIDWLVHLSEINLKSNFVLYGQFLLFNKGVVWILNCQVNFSTA